MMSLDDLVLGCTASTTFNGLHFGAKDKDRIIASSTFAVPCHLILVFAFKVT